MAMTLNELKAQLSGLNEYQGEDEATLRARAEAAYKPQYEQQLSDLQRTLQSQLAAQNRSALSNGMQRSSYNQAQQASLRTGGLQAEAQLGAQYQSNLGSTLLQLMEAEKDRKQNADNARDSLLLQLYQLGKKSSGGGGAKTPDPNETKDDGKDDINDQTLDDMLGGSKIVAYDKVNNPKAGTAPYSDYGYIPITATSSQTLDEAINSYLTKKNTVTSNLNSRLTAPTVASKRLTTNQILNGLNAKK